MNKKKNRLRIEYRVHFDDGNMYIIEGKNWREWKDYLGKPDVLWIERVEDILCDDYGVIKSEYETMWEVEE